MMGVWRRALLCAAAFGTAFGTASSAECHRVSPAEYEVKSMPGMTDTFEFKHYAGYMPICDGQGTELFFWFVESQGSVATDPLVVWFNGGPGSSSVKYGFWAEHGPFRLVPGDGPGGFKPTLYAHSWNRIANVLYVEAPAGVGFSFSKDTTKYNNITDAESSYDNFLFLMEWFKAFPQFKENPFYISAESYGGHYGPTLAEQLIKNPNDINMKGMWLGNPGINSDWYYNVNEYAFTTFMWSHGWLPAPEYMAARDACGWTEIFKDCSRDFTHPSAKCVAATEKLLNYLPNNIDLYDVDAPVCLNPKTLQQVPRTKRAMTPFLRHLNKQYNLTLSPGFDPCMQDYSDAYMNTHEVMHAVHVWDKFPGRKGGQKWPEDAPGWAYNEGVEGAKKDIALLFPKFFAERPHWKLVVVSGTADAAVPFMGTERWMNCLNREIADPWRSWKLSNGQVGGTLKRWDNIDFVTVRGCGHTIPTYCPLAGFEMLQNWLTGQWPKND